MYLKKKNMYSTFADIFRSTIDKFDGCGMAKCSLKQYTRTLGTLPQNILCECRLQGQITNLAHLLSLLVFIRMQILQVFYQDSPSFRQYSLNPTSRHLLTLTVCPSLRAISAYAICHTINSQSLTDMALTLSYFYFIILRALIVSIA